MNTNIEKTADKPSFFKKRGIETTDPITKSLSDRKEFFKKTSSDDNIKDDAKVTISDAIKDFSRIKKAVDEVPAMDNSSKIQGLRDQINAGTYNIDYEALADKILSDELGNF